MCGSIFLCCSAKKIVGADVVVIAEGEKVMDGQFVRAALVASVHGLRRAKNVRDLLLRQVVILTQIAHALDICHVHIFTPPMC